MTNIFNQSALSFVKLYKYILIFLAIELCINVFQLYTIELTPKEIYYYISYAQNLHWGYIEMPPMMAFFIKAGVAIFGKNVFGIRCFALLTALFVKASLVYCLKTKGSDKKQLNIITIGLCILGLNVFNLYISEITPLLFFMSLWAILHFKIEREPTIIINILYCLSLSGLVYSSYWGYLFFLIIVISTAFIIKIKHFWLLVFCSLLLCVPHLNWLYLYHNTIIVFFNSKFNTQVNWHNILYTFAIMLILLGPFVWYHSVFSIGKIIKQAPAFFKIQGILFIVCSFSILGISAWYSFNWNAYSLLAIPIFYIFFYKLTQINATIKLMQINLFLCCFVLLIFRSLDRYHEKLIKESKETLQKKEIVFIDELVGTKNIGFLNSNILAASYDFYNNTKSFNIESFNQPISEYQLFHAPYLTQHCKVVLLSNTKPSQNNWDTIFQKNKNIFYKTIDTFVYWKECRISNINVVKSGTTKHIEFVLKTPLYITDNDLQTMIIALINYDQKMQHIIVPILKTTIIGAHAYQIIANDFDDSTLSSFKNKKLGISILQNDDIYYLNSDTFNATQIGI